MDLTTNIIEDDLNYSIHKFIILILLVNLCSSLPVSAQQLYAMSSSKSKINKSVANSRNDTDGDGIPNSEDACPEIAGIKKMKGCPDSDGDGFSDQEDLCPEIFGLEAYNGCPDSDNDGVMDSMDHCPYIAGAIENKGCPGRNVAVAKNEYDIYRKRETKSQSQTSARIAVKSPSKTPTANKIETLTNSPSKSPSTTKIKTSTNSPTKTVNVTKIKTLSKSPTNEPTETLAKIQVKNSTKNPAKKLTRKPTKSKSIIPIKTVNNTITKNVAKRATRKISTKKTKKHVLIINNLDQDIINSIAEEIDFEVGKAKFKSSSLESLKGITLILFNFPKTKWNIEGHTDSVGSVEANLKLSKERANAVKNYLISHGLSRKNFVPIGYGEKKPIDSNMYKNGRAKNRRVVFKFIN